MTDPRLDRKTRGRTTPGRLSALDAFLIRAERALLVRSEGPWARASFVDVGFGEQPWTTLESAGSFRELNPTLEVMAFELEAHRVATAQPFRDASTRFVAGGFDEVAGMEGAARMVRVMNVIRAYPPPEVAAIHAKLAQPLLPGGLLIDGSTNTEGGVLTAHLLRREAVGARREGLLFHTDFTRGFAPWLFRDWLPRDLRRSVRAGTPIHAFFTRWNLAWEQARASAPGAPSAVFAATARVLRAEGEPLHPDEWLEQSGYLVWMPPDGVPAGA